MGSWIPIARVVTRLTLAFLAILVGVLLALDVAAFTYLAREHYDLLEPTLGTPEGQAAYHAALTRIIAGLAALDLPLLLVAGLAAYALARVSVRPLMDARERERQFAADAAHELRTPLARISALADSGDAAAIRAIALDASATIGDLLTLISAEQIHERLSEPVELGAFVRSTVRELDPETITFDLNTDREVWVSGDERQLRRLLTNLIGNALRFAVRTIRITLEIDGRFAVIGIEDDGPGVPAEVRERVFERFVRWPQEGSGSGLGLAICRAIARAHGGDVLLTGANHFSARLPALDLKEV